jgi:hypothetical protein
MNDTQDITPELARKMHRTLEAYHGVVYFAPDPAARYEALGLTGRSGYFASRVAAMGAVDTEVVVATFFNFDPQLVRTSMDGVWDRVSPDEVLAARDAGADEMLRRLLGDAVGSSEMHEAAELARLAATDLPVSGRPLFAGHARLDWPDEPHMVLWRAQTLIREFRGDGHLAALLTCGIENGCEALVQHASTGEIPADVLRSSRAWSREAWAQTVDTLVDRGWVHPDGSATEEGRRIRDEVEALTDRLALAPWRRLGRDGSDRLRELVRPFSRTIVASGELGFR